MKSISEASSKAADSKKTPQVVDHGEFLLVDSTLIDLQSKEIELNENNSQLLSFVIMP